MRNWLIIVLIFCSWAAWSQNDTLTIGKEYKSPKRTSFEGFIGSDSSSIYSLDYEYISKRKHSLYLNQFDKKTLSLRATHNITPVVDEELYVEPIEIFNINQHIYLATKLVNPETDVKRVAIFPIKLNAKVESPILLDTIFSMQDRVNDFKIVVSESNENFIIITRRPFFQNQNTSYNVRKYDHNYNLIWEDVVTLPYVAKNFEFVDVDYDGDGQIMMLTKKLDITGTISNKLKKIDNNKYFLWVYKHDNSSLKEFEIMLKDKWITGIKMVFKKEKVFVAGYFSGKRNISLKGFFNLRFDEGLNLLSASVKSMSTEDLAKFIKKDNLDEKSHLYDFYLRDVFVLDNEEIVLIGEKYFKEIDTYYDPRTDISSYTDIYNYNSVLVTKLGQNGKMIQNIKIPKYQSTINDNGYYSSICYGVKGNDVWVFFNDNFKNVELGNDLNAQYKVLYNNRRVVPVYAKISEENEVTRKWIQIPDDGFLFVPRYSDQLEDENFYFIRERGRTAKIVRFHL